MLKLIHTSGQHKVIQKFEKKEISEERIRQVLMSQIAGISMCVCYVMIIGWLIHLNEPIFSILFTKNMKEFVINAVFADTRPLEDVDTRQTMIEYIESTVLKNLFEIRGEESLSYINSKVIGVPRVRQIRVKSNWCEVDEVWKGTLGKQCYDIINGDSIEKNHYTPFWEKQISACNYSDDNAVPWCYQTSQESGSHRIYGKHFSYPGVGYVADLGVDLDDSLYTLNLLLESNWFDAQTRVLIVEFSTYNANANIFNSVSVIIHRTATGRYLTDYKISTYKFLFDDLRTLMYTSSILFFIVILGFLSKLYLENSLSSFRVFISKSWNIIDSLDIFCSMATCVTYFARDYYVRDLLREVKRYDQDVYISFSTCIYLEGVIDIFILMVIVCSMLRFCRVFRFFEIVHTVQRTITASAIPMVSLFVVMTMLLFGFATYFHIVLGTALYDCRTFHSTLITLLIMPLGLATYFIHDLISVRNYMTFVFYGLFYIVHMILIIHLFMTLIICNYHSTIRMNRPKINLRALRHSLLYIFKQISSKLFGRLKVQEKSVFKMKPIVSTMQLRAMKYIVLSMYQNSLASGKGDGSLKYKHKCMQMLTADVLNSFDNDRRFHMLISDKIGKYCRKKHLRTMLHVVKNMLPQNFQYKYDKTDKRVHEMELSKEMEKIGNQIKYCNTKAAEIQTELKEMVEKLLSKYID